MMVKWMLGNSLATFSSATRLREADGDDGILPALGKAPLRLLELRLVGGLELGDGDPGFLREFLGARGSRLR